jgi:Bacterial PH domain
MSDIEQGREHGAEPVRGLPGRLPQGEHIVWQGSPQARGVMRRVLKSRWIAAYFVIAAVWSAAVGINDGVAMGGILLQLGYIGLLAAVVFGLMAAFAKAVERTSVYTITNRRVVMRVGVALSASFNLPYAQISGADFRARADGSGDIALVLKPGHGLSSAVFWPHQKGRVWSPLSPEMICLKDVSTIAAMLALQLQAHQARAAQATAHAADERAVPPIRPAQTRPERGGASLQPAE